MPLLKINLGRRGEGNVNLNPAILRRDMAAKLNSRHTETFAGKGISTCTEAGDATVWRGFGMKLAFIIALLLAASQVAAQNTTANQQQQPLGAGGLIVTSPLTNTGTICQEEMVATFCNVPTGPNTAGYGSNRRCRSDQRRNYHAFSGYPGLWRRHRNCQRAVQLRRCASKPPEWNSFGPLGGGSRVGMVAATNKGVLMAIRSLMAAAG